MRQFNSSARAVPPERRLVCVESGQADLAVVLKVPAGNALEATPLSISRLHAVLLYRWFVGLGMEVLTWDHSTDTRNRDRLIENKAVRALLKQT